MRELIKFGLHYHTREGEHVRILTTSRKSERYPVVGLLDRGKEEEALYFTKTGCYDHDTRRHPYDLERDK